jgi:peptidoglycan/xylan/chitin deacetylase (PgdA/CDA1 family)
VNGMRTRRAAKALLFSGVVVLLLAACSPAGAVLSPSPVPPTPTASRAPAAATPTLLLFPSPTPVLTFTPSPWPVQGPGAVVCPILLYHRIATPPFPNDYYVTPDAFREQMQALRDWGYTAIPISLLVRAITQGAPLPERPVVITFDDGDISVYTTAFPIMREFGFVGVNYLVGNRLQVEGYMNVAQLQELSAAGWEVGSHSMTHADLRTSHDLDWEIRQSRLELEAALGVPVATFAYPYGLGNDNESIVEQVRANYVAAVGLGPYLEQNFSRLYYLARRPVLYGWDLERFASFLPWSEPLP